VTPQEFHEAAIANGYGPLLDLSILPKSTAAHFDRLRKLAEHWIGAVRRLHQSMPPIYFDFIDDDLPNAFPFHHQGKYFIGVTSGAAYALGLLFPRILADNRNLTHIGKLDHCIQLPTLTLPPVSYASHILDALFAENLANGPGVRPRGERMACSNLLVQFAFTFLILHEVAHIAHGHVDYLESLTLSLREFGFVPGSMEEAIEFQAMEYDADVFGVAHSTDNVRQMVEKLSGKGIDLTYYDLSYLLLFAIFSFFRLFADTPLAGNDLYASSHPPFRIRVAIVWRIVTKLADQLGISPIDFGKNVAAAATAVEQAFHHLTGDPMAPVERYVEMGDPIGQEYFKRIVKHWNSGLRDALVKHGYAEPVLLADYDDIGFCFSSADLDVQP
jgi:hypothetical protein